MKYEKIFEPINVGKVIIKNRIVMAPMGIFKLADHEGGLTQQIIDYYSERSFGGVGLIITGSVRMTNLEPRFGRMFLNNETCYSFAELAESVHFYGAKIFVQLTAGVGRILGGPLIDRGIKPVSASVIPTFWRPNVMTRALTTAEVEDIVQAFGNGAKLLKAVGIDGVELHGHQGFLIDQFVTAIWNRRNDKYGGSLENRLRFPIEILNSIKENAGSDFPVSYRYGLKHFMKETGEGALGNENYVEAGRDIPEGLAMAKLLEKAGFDALHIDAGSYEGHYWTQPPNYQPHGCLVNLSAEVKKTVTIPIIAVGRLDVPELAERALQEKKMDMVALGRGLLADPHWPKKVHEGRIVEILPCIGCHYCLYRTTNEFKPIGCTVNPAVGKERLYTLRLVQRKSKVLIVGGGVAGMEAARVSAIKGSEVTLYEESENLGGHLIAASVPDFKHDIRRLLDWYKYQLEKLGVKSILQVCVNTDLIRKENPDKVILATGSTAIIPDVLGIEKAILTTCTDLLLGKKKAGKSVVIIGGGIVGCETALWLANQGKKVTIVEALSEMATGIAHVNRLMLLDMLKYKRVEFINDTCLEEVREDSVRVIHRNLVRKTIICDTVALAIGFKSRTELYEPLRGGITELYMVGDCQQPKKIKDAIWSAYYIASR